MTEDLLKLAEKVEAATGPDRELDGCIWWHTGVGPSEYPEYAHLTAIVALGRVFGRIPTVPEDHLTIAEVGYRGPRYTVSLDAAMSLVPEGWAIDRISMWPAAPEEADNQTPAQSTVEMVGTSLKRMGRKMIWGHGGKDGRARATASNPALALTAACLRARAAALQGEG